MHTEHRPKAIVERAKSIQVTGATDFNAIVIKRLSATSSATACRAIDSKRLERVYNRRLAHIKVRKIICSRNVGLCARNPNIHSVRSTRVSSRYRVPRQAVGNKLKGISGQAAERSHIAINGSRRKPENLNAIVATGIA